MTPWTVSCQAPLSMGFSRQECWSGLPFASPGDFPDTGVAPASLKVSCTGRQVLYHKRHLGSFFVLTLHPCFLSGVIENIFWLIFILWVRSETTYFYIYLSFSPIILQLFCRESRQNLLPIANIILFFRNSTGSHQYLIQWSHEPGELGSSSAIKGIRPLSL